MDDFLIHSSIIIVDAMFDWESQRWTATIYSWWSSTQPQLCCCSSSSSPVLISWWSRAPEL